MNIPHSYQLFTAEGSRALDERTISEFGIDGFTLMEIAGTRAADFILQNLQPDDEGLILCGKGNNAGDALVVTRLLVEHGINCSVLFVAGKYVREAVTIYCNGVCQESFFGLWFFTLGFPPWRDSETIHSVP